MQERVITSFIVRVIREPDNEQMPWNITVHHVQNERVYRLTDLMEIGTLCKDLAEADAQPKSAKVIPLDTDRLGKKGSEKYE